jgi:hypothetical protein
MLLGVAALSVAGRSAVLYYLGGCLFRDQEHTKVPLKAESLYPTMAGRLNATAAFQAPAFLCRKV